MCVKSSDDSNNSSSGLRTCSSDRKCLDYVTRSFCTTESGTFSTNTSCDTRKTSAESICIPILGACCINGTCRETSESLCIEFGGSFETGKTCYNATACRLSEV